MVNIYFRLPLPQNMVSRNIINASRSSLITYSLINVGITFAALVRMHSASHSWVPPAPGMTRYSPWDKRGRFLRIKTVRVQNKRAARRSRKTCSARHLLDGFLHLLWRFIAWWRSCSVLVWFPSWFSRSHMHQPGAICSMPPPENADLGSNAHALPAQLFRGVLPACWI